MRLVRAAASLSLIAFVVVSCGSDAKEDVRAATTDFALAYLRADGAAACERMTAEFQEEALAGIKEGLEDLDARTEEIPDCESAMGLAAAISTGRASPPDTAPGDLREAEAAIETLESGDGLGAVDVDDDRATVAGVAGFEDSRFELRKVDGEWRVSGGTNG